MTAVQRLTGQAAVNRRARHLVENPWCVKCFDRRKFTLATEVDHVRALMNGGDDSYAPGTVQSLCHDCHRVKTAKDKGNRICARVDAAGYPIKDD